MAISFQQLIDWFKRRPLRAAILGIIFVSAAQLFHAYLGNPLKITNPANPWFDPKQFSIYDYPYSDSLEPALAQMFPRGTDKSYVDFIMYSAGATPSVNAGNARSSVGYKFRAGILRYWNSGPVIVFEFDANAKVQNIRPFGRQTDIFSTHITD